MVEKLHKWREIAKRVLAIFVITAAVEQQHMFDLVAGASWLLRMVPGFPKLDISQPPGLLFQGLYIVSLLAIYTFLEILVDVTVDNIAFVRRWIMWNEDIEGNWLEVVFRSDRIVYGALIRVTYSAATQGYVISGQDFDEKGLWREWFTSDLCAYKERSLSYRFWAIKPGEETDGTGHGECNFLSSPFRSWLSRVLFFLPSDRVSQYRGYFYAVRETHRYYFHGERLNGFMKEYKAAHKRRSPKAVDLPDIVKAFIDSRKGFLPFQDGV